MGKKKRPVTYAVNLSLPQSRDKSVDVLYRLLRNRTRHKSRTDRSDVGIRAELLVIEFVVRGIARPTGVLVEQGSFETIVENGVEMGFKAKVDSILGIGVLRVFKTGTAYVEEI